MGSKHIDTVWHFDCLGHQPVRMDTSCGVLEVPYVLVINPFVAGLWRHSGILGGGFLGELTAVAIY